MIIELNLKTNEGEHIEKIEINDNTYKDWEHIAKTHYNISVEELIEKLLYKQFNMDNEEKI